MTREELDASGDWAFPAQHTPEHTPGMTLRDYFAGQALIGMGNWTDGHSIGLVSAAQNKARWAYQVADAMLEARKQR